MYAAFIRGCLLQAVERSSTQRITCKADNVYTCKASNYTCKANNVTNVHVCMGPVAIFLTQRVATAKFPTWRVGWRPERG